MKRFQIMPKKPHFLTLIPYNPRIKIFFQKNKNVTFFPLSSYNFVPKIITILWTVFEISTGRTHVRTHERELIGPNRSAGDQQGLNLKNLAVV